MINILMNQKPGPTDSVNRPTGSREEEFLKSFYHIWA